MAGAFFYTSLTYFVPAATGVGPAVLVSTSRAGTNYRVSNVGTALIAFTLEADPLAAGPVFPVDDVPQRCHVILPGVTEVFGGPEIAYVRTATLTGTGGLYVAKGEGL